MIRHIPHISNRSRGASRTIFFVMTTITLQKLSEAVSNKALSRAQSARTRGDKFAKSATVASRGLLQAPLTIESLRILGKNFDLLQSVPPPFNYCVNAHINIAIDHD